ncbi:MAG: PD-(D/E)XK nuclease family protein [Patescibacteria group bacterium]
MSKFYNPKRSRNIFDPASKTPFKLSRSKIDNFLACPRCFYFDRRLGIGQPPGFPFNLNKAVDTLLKKEFDIHRAAGNPHPLMKTYKVDAIPYKNENMEKWRDALREGIQYFHEPTNFIITGAIDDIWVNPKGELIIVDYKATSKTSEVTLDAEWQDGYKRQMEIYQWLFRKNDFKVNETGYFVYCNGDADKEAFDGKLEFDIKLLPYKGDDSWVETAILKAHECLMGDEIPDMGTDCDFCAYRKAIGEVEK